MKELAAALRIFAALTILTGVAYPLAVWGIGQAAFHEKANGSLIMRGGKVVGSQLIGQAFDSPEYFWGRPSATGGSAAVSGGSNLGPTNPALIAAIQERVKKLRSADPGNKKPVPTDLVTASGSGLDPHISPAAAEFQIARVARARSMTEMRVRTIVQRHTEYPSLGILGEARVNVLTLNLALDEEQSK